MIVSNIHGSYQHEIWQCECKAGKFYVDYDNVSKNCKVVHWNYPEITPTTKLLEETKKIIEQKKTARKSWKRHMNETIEKQKQIVRNENELLNQFIRLIDKNDKRFSFEWLALGECATMEIFDKEKKIGYFVKVEPIECDKNGDVTNL